jgi:hypothetical protein
MKLSLFFSLSFSLLFSPLSSFPSRTPSDLQADSMEILPGTASVLCCPLIFSFATGISTGIFLVLHNQLGVHYSLYFSFASAFWGASSTCVGTATGLKAGRTQRFLSPLSWRTQRFPSPLSNLRAITATAASPPAASI